jgi:hypothetical protein
VPLVVGLFVNELWRYTGHTRRRSPFHIPKSLSSQPKRSALMVQSLVTKPVPRLQMPHTAFNRPHTLTSSSVSHQAPVIADVDNSRCDRTGRTGREDFFIPSVLPIPPCSTAYSVSTTQTSIIFVSVNLSVLPSLHLIAQASVVQIQFVIYNIAPTVSRKRPPYASTPISILPAFQ